MARTTTKKPPAKRKAGTPPRKARRTPKAAKAAKTAKIAPRKPAVQSKARSKDKGFDNAADALAALLESPFVTELIAAGAAAGLAAMTHSALSKKQGGAKAARKAGAIFQRLRSARTLGSFTPQNTAN